VLTLSRKVDECKPLGGGGGGGDGGGGGENEHERTSADPEGEAGSLVRALAEEIDALVHEAGVELPRARSKAMPTLRRQVGRCRLTLSNPC